MYDNFALQAVEYIATLGWGASVLLILGAVLMVLTGLKAFLHSIVLRTKSETDDKVYKAVYSVIDLLPKTVLFIISKFKKK